MPVPLDVKRQIARLRYLNLAGKYVMRVGRWNRSDKVWLAWFFRHGEFIV